MIKVVTLFLVAMMILAIFGKLRMPRITRSAKCPDCARPRIGRGPCDCKKSR
ncbi:MAG: hypothetical protein WDA25_05685 [Paracoccaceae bacterium]